MSDRYVVDTTSLISYFHDVFNTSSRISLKASNLIERGFTHQDVVLIIPSVVFIEIFKKWFSNEEFISKFHYEVYSKIQSAETISINAIEQEVLENVPKIGGIMEKHEVFDKIILASAMMYECPIITSDTKIIEYVKSTQVIPGVIY